MRSQLVFHNKILAFIGSQKLHTKSISSTKYFHNKTMEIIASKKLYCIRDQLLQNISNNSITRLSHLLAPKLHKSISRNKMKIPL
jgi:hypothetical protein